MLNMTHPMKTTLYRVILPVRSIEDAARFYAHVLGQAGERVSSGRHYFDCGAILACYDPRADGDGVEAQPNPDHVYIAVEDLEAAFERARAAGPAWIEEEIETRPWGERSFYLKDPSGNPLCFVQAGTEFTGAGRKL
jgi:predicted enzyme related to lactoylglutathione lyase